MHSPIRKPRKTSKISYSEYFHSPLTENLYEKTSKQNNFLPFQEFRKKEIKNFLLKSIDKTTWISSKFYSKINNFA